MEAKIKIAVLCFDVSDIDIITVNNRLMETLKQNIDLPEKEKLFVDTDHRMSNLAQEDFVYRVMKRLESEHNSTHKIKTINRDYIHVIVK